MKKILVATAIAAATAALTGCGGGADDMTDIVAAAPEASAVDVDIEATPMASLSSVSMQATMATAGGFSSRGHSPSTIRSRYGFDTLTSPAQQGSGQIIVIISAYNNPNAGADLAKFSAQHGLPACPTVPTVVTTGANGYPSARVDRPAPGDGCTFQVVNVNANGRVAATAPQNDITGAWIGESSMDIEWAHATAPMAKIVLVQATNSMIASLAGAGKYASTIADVVSMSWGAPEALLAQPACTAADRKVYPDCTVTTKTQRWLYGPANPILPNGSINYTAGGWDTQAFSNPDVTYVAASGDAGAAPIWPSISSKVLAVGGTAITGGNDTGWKYSGGGTSIYYSSPNWQTVSGNTKRTTPDVAMAADSATPLSVYVTPQTNFPDAACVKVKGAANCGWYAGYGTSISAPMWAGLAAVSNATRLEAGKSKTNFQAALYQLASVQGNYVMAFTDVIKGNNGTEAKVGYDTVTGLGVPKAGVLIDMLAAQ